MSVERQSGAAYWLWEQEQEVQRSIDRLTTDIEGLEADIVRSRAKRDDLQLVAAEMRVARSMLEQSGLRVERRGTDVHVSVDKVLADPPDSA